MYFFITFRIVCVCGVARQRVNEERLSHRCASFCSLHSRYELDRRHFNGRIIVDCRASKYTLIPYVSYNGRRVPVSWRAARSHLPMPRNRLTVNRSSRIKIISLSASGPASVSIRQRDRVSDERSPDEVTFYSAEIKV